MTTFKHGDKVICTIMLNGVLHDITDAKISIDDAVIPYICHNNPNCDWSEADDMFGYPYCLRLSSNFTNDYVDDLKLAVRNVRDAVAGDVVTNERHTYTVIDSLPNSVFLRCTDDHVLGWGLYIRDDLEKDFTFVESTPPEEMTLAEVCKALGKDIIIKG